MSDNDNIPDKPAVQGLESVARSGRKSKRIFSVIAASLVAAIGLAVSVVTIVASLPDEQLRKIDLQGDSGPQAIGESRYPSEDAALEVEAKFMKPNNFTYWVVPMTAPFETFPNPSVIIPDPKAGDYFGCSQEQLTWLARYATEQRTWFYLTFRNGALDGPAVAVSSLRAIGKLSVPPSGTFEVFCADENGGQGGAQLVHADLVLGDDSLAVVSAVQEQLESADVIFEPGTLLQFNLRPGETLQTDTRLRLTDSGREFVGDVVATVSLNGLKSDVILPLDDPGKFVVPYLTVQDFGAKVVSGILYCGDWNYTYLGETQRRNSDDFQQCSVADVMGILASK